MYKLAIDIGNSNSVLGVYSDKLLRIADFPTEDFPLEETVDVFSRIIEGLEIKKTAISSVVPGKENFWSDYILDTLKITPLIINNKSKIPIKIKVKNRSNLGADRICNAVSGYMHFKRKNNVIVIDMGTAITFDIVKQNGDFIGGVIMPGVWTSAKSLFVNTGKLPLVSEKELSFPAKITGDNTKSAIKSGLMNSALFTIDGYVKAIKSEFKRDFKVVLSGGNGKIFHKKLSFKTYYIRNTVLDGLNIIMDNN